MMRIWSVVQWKVLLCFKVNWRQWCMPGDSGDRGIPQCRIWTPTWEWRGNEVETTTEKVKWGGGNRKVVIDAHALVWTWIFFQVYVSHYVCVNTCEGDRLWRRKEEKRQRGVLIASASPKKTWKKGGINRREGDYGERETPNPRCTQFGNTARCHGNTALPQSQSPHAERQRQGNNKNTFHHWNTARREERELARWDAEKYIKRAGALNPHKSHNEPKLCRRYVLKGKKRRAWEWYTVVIQLWSPTKI